MGERIRRLAEWLRERTGIDHLPFKRVPYSYMNLGAWLGAVVAASFVLLAITGLILLVYYDPANPAETNKELLETKPFFNLILTTHLYAAHAMIIAALIHMIRGLYHKLYDKPRELLWILGVITGFTAIQTAFFGYSAIGDTTAYEAIMIGKGLIESSLGPWLGKTLGALAFGAEGIDFGRVIAFHVIMAALLGLLFALHFGLFETIGPKIKEKAGELAPWFPVNFLYMTALTLGVWGIIILADAISQAIGFVHRLLYPLPIFEDSELAALVRPMPPWFLVYAYKLFQFGFLYLRFDFIDVSYSALPVLILSMIVPPLVLAGLPFLDKSREEAPLARPKAIALATYLVTLFAQLTVWGAATLGYASIATVIAVFLSPAIVIFGGLWVASKYWRGEIPQKKAYTIQEGIILVASIIPFIAAIAAGSTQQAWAEAAVAYLGIVLGSVFLYLVGKYSAPQEEKVTGTFLPDMPPEMLVAGLASLLVTSISAALVAYSGLSAIELILPTTIQVPPQIDPLVNPAGVAALFASLFLGAASLIYLLYRAVTWDKIPYKGPVKELLPHLPAYIAFAVALALIL